MSFLFIKRMKNFPILLIAALIISCSRTLPTKNTDSSIPVVEIPPISNQTAESNLSLPALPDEVVAVIPVKVPAFPTPEKVNKEDFLRKEKLTRLKEFGLYDLEKRQLTKDDLEIRVWQINSLFMTMYKSLAVIESVFILRQTNGNWSAEVVRNTIKGKSDVEKLIKTKLDAPKSGWENVWLNLIDNEFLTFPDSVSGEVDYGTDASIFITETKVDGIFKTYEHAGNGEVREVRHAARILNIIAEEFNLEDFQATKKYQ